MEFNSISWLKVFLAGRQLVTPDGRPLFEYRVAPDEFESLAKLCCGKIPIASHDAAAFSLYSAEWWRRYGKGLEWEGLCESLKLGEHYTELYQPLERGLHYWRRKVSVRMSQTGGNRSWRDFVGTLSREGGLPLQLLLDNDTNIRRFFTSLFERRQLDGELDSATVAIAARVLPEAWQHPDIYELAAAFVCRIWQLREKVESSDDPRRDLDAVLPGWQLTLPVVVEGSVADAMIRGLVRDAQSIAERLRAPVSVQTCLVDYNGAWSVERYMSVATKLSETQVRKMVGSTVEDLPRRLSLVLVEGSSETTLAIATQWKTSEPYSVENVVEMPRVVPTDEDLRPAMRHGNLRCPIFTVPGGEALDEGPWVFARPGGVDTPWEIVAHGSAKLSCPEIHVATATNAKVRVSGGICTPAGNVGNRLLWHGSGSPVLEVLQDDCTYQIDCSQTEDSIWNYRFEGSELDTAGSTPVWLGMPQIVAVSESGRRRAIEQNELQWRMPGGVWRSMSHECVGRVEVRHQRNGTTSFARWMHVVPTKTKVSYMQLDNSGCTGIALTGSRAVTARPRVPKQLGIVLIPISG